MKSKLTEIGNLGQLKLSGYTLKGIKDEMRDNLIEKMRTGIKRFEGIYGFEDTVIPDLERAILSRHNILLLGLRGQAKTRIARIMVELLDEYIPVVAGSEINDDPLAPISTYAKKMVENHGDETPVTWLHRSERYVEKLATPDVSISDLIGDIDPIKAAAQKLTYADEGVIHYGIVPRSHRSIFVINELPDLQARIQVSLFNLLQERDIQIRGFKMRLPLDIAFVFTANPEDYTNRGSIITPLKDRIESQILTHYPTDLETAKRITKQESKLAGTQKEHISILELHHDLLEGMVMKARESELVDAKSGVSARVAISAYENLVSAVERRVLIKQGINGHSRIADFHGIIPSVTGKMELVYEGEQEGSVNVAWKLLSEAMKDLFLQYFPNPEAKRRDKDIYGVIRAYFSGGNRVTIPQDGSEAEYREALDSVAGLKRLVREAGIDENQTYAFMELALHGLSEFQVIGKSLSGQGLEFSDPLSVLFEDDED